MRHQLPAASDYDASDAQTKRTSSMATVNQYLTISLLNIKHGENILFYSSLHEFATAVRATGAPSAPVSSEDGDSSRHIVRA